MMPDVNCLDSRSIHLQGVGELKSSHGRSLRAFGLRVGFFVFDPACNSKRRDKKISDRNAHDVHLVDLLVLVPF